MTKLSFEYAYTSCLRIQDLASAVGELEGAFAVVLFVYLTLKEALIHGTAAVLPVRRTLVRGTL